MSATAFLQDHEYYRRDIDPIRQYVEQTAFYISVMTGQSVDSIKPRIIQAVRDKKIKAKDPEVVFFHRQDNGDKIKESLKLSAYLRDTKDNKQVLAPTMTCYINAEELPSKLVGFLEGNVVKRSKAKKEAFKAKANKQLDLYVIKDNEQANAKRFNNSVSGAFGSEGSVLRNPTAHSTLTSITRTVSSIGNSSNEKIIAGNRHYHNPDVVLNNLIYISSICDKEAMNAIVQKYGLVYPTADQVMEMVLYSSKLYWTDKRHEDRIRTFVDKLEPVYRAAVVYGGDLYQIRRLNPEFTDRFISGMAAKGYYEGEDPIKVITSTDEMYVNYVHQICLVEVKGIGKNYGKLSEEKQRVIAGTCVSLTNYVEAHKDFLATLFLTRNIPASTAYIPHMVRRSVVLSDTDSTMFSVDDWVINKFGKLTFEPEAFAYAGAVMFIATQCIAHNLAIFSANMDVARNMLHRLAMKPEFVFPVFAQTSVAKHYYTCVLAKEGNVYEEVEMEIKGVHLKNSATPQQINKQAHAAMEAILHKVMAGEKISMVQELGRISTLERSISNSLMSSETTYLKRSKVKQPAAYGKDRPVQSTPYLYHILWEDVFQAKYGAIVAPPYSSIKIPTVLNNKSKTQSWVDGIEDKDLGRRLREWMAKYQKKEMPTLYFSMEYIMAYGIPDEVKPIINQKKIILDMTKTDRIILESLGYFPKRDTLVSESGY